MKWGVQSTGVGSLFTRGLWWMKVWAGDGENLRQPLSRPHESSGAGWAWTGTGLSKAGVQGGGGREALECLIMPNCNSGKRMGGQTAGLNQMAGQCGPQRVRGCRQDRPGGLSG